MPLTDGQKLLFQAIITGDRAKIAQYLTLNSHTNLRLVTEPLMTMWDEQDNSPLHLAVANEDPEILRLLLSLCPEANVSIGNQQQFTPLHHAAHYGRVSAIGLLLCYRANVDAQSVNGDTPLHMAVKANHLYVVEILINSNANLYIRNNEGKNALEIAVQNQNQQIVELLLESGFNTQEYIGDKTAQLRSLATPAIDAVVMEYLPLTFYHYPSQAQFKQALELLSAEQLEALFKEIFSEHQKLLTHAEMQLVDHLHRCREVKAYPNSLPGYATFIEPSKGIVTKTPFNESCLYLYVPSVMQNDIFYDAKIVVLPQGQVIAGIINHLVSSLVYEARHHANLPSYQSATNWIRWSIGRLNSRYCTYTDEAFENLIIRRERRGRDFFGLNLSDDSDDQLVGLALNEHELQQVHSASIRANATGTAFFEQELKKILTREKRPTEDDANDRNDQLLKANHLKERAKIPYGLYTFASPNEKEFFFKNVDKDLMILNRHLRNGMPIAKAVTKVKTTFFIAQYRGVSYDVRWNAPSRRAHRKADESKVASFSSSVYAATRFDFFREYNAERHLSEDMQALLQLIGHKLRDMLYAMHRLEDYEYNSVVFDNFAEFVQDFYSKGYKKFHESLSAGALKSYIGTYFLNDKNPFISTSDRPYHALRYACGIKPYADNEKNRIRPRWGRTGQAERPYSGKVYISLHPLSDYNQQYPSHLVSMVRKGKSDLNNIILAERETTFPAMIDSGRVIATHVARYPSFKNNYHPKYLEKYGMGEQLYTLFGTALKSFPPHSYENRFVKKLLGNWLVAFHETRLIQEAFNEAWRRNGVLIYRDDEGYFTRELPEYGVWNGRQNKDEIMLMRGSRRPNT